MAKTYLGIDIGYDSLKLALVSGGVVKKTASAPMPLNLLRDGRITSTESLGELLRGLMREQHIRANKAAVALSGEVTYLRTTSMPAMSADQLAFNIPYEFSDYITDELKNYVFDYAVLPSDGKEAEEEAGRIPLMTAAVPAAVLDDLRQAFRKAGLQLAKAAPVEGTFLNLLRLGDSKSAEKEYCILDLGYRAIRMFMYHGGRHVATRTMDVGLSSIDDVIADARGVDTHLAHTYLLNNFEDCQHQEYCINAFGNISVELMRAVNFYRFSNPDSQLSGVWLCGGGAMIEPLRENLAQTLEMEIHSAAEFIRGAYRAEDGYSYVQAVSATLD